MSNRSPILAPLALAAILATGFGVVLAVLVCWVDQLVGNYLRAAQAETSRQVYVATNGTPLLQSYSPWDLRQVFHTLEGEEIVVPPGDRPPLLDGASLREPSQLVRFEKLPWTRRIVQFVPPLRPAMLWYFIHDGLPEGAGYFVAYDVKTKLCAGYLGMKGFRSERPSPGEWLPVDSRLMAWLTAFNGLTWYGGISRQMARGIPDPEMGPWRCYLISGDQLLEIDFKEHSVRSVLEAEGLMSLNLMERAADASSQVAPRVPPELSAFLALRMPGRVVVMHPHRAERRTYLLPDEARQRHIQFFELTGQTALLLMDRFFFGERKYLLLWIDPAGKVLRREEVVGWKRTAWNAPATRAWVSAAAVPTPLGLAAFVATELANQYRQAGDLGAGQYVASAFWVAWPALIAVTALSAGLTALVWRRQRRYGAAGTALWMVFVVLGGVPGLLAYRFHRRWPVRQACPACGETVPRDRDACAHCGEDFPAPSPKGVEVFAP